LFGVGFLIGHRACVWLAVGAAYSLVTWYLQDAGAAAVTSYTRHLYYPWVLACGVGLILGYSISSLVRVRGPLARSLRETTMGIAARRPVRLPRSARVGGIAVLAGLVVAAIALATAEPAVIKPAGIVLLALLLVVTLTVFLNRAGGEIGLVPLAPALYFSVALFAVVGVSSRVAMLTAATICCAATSSVYFTYSAKVAQERPAPLGAPPGKLVTGTQVIGGLAGSAVGVAVVVVLARAGAIGGSAFPAPVATAVGFVDSAIRGSSSYPGSIGLALAIAAPVGAALTFTAALPTMLGLGVLLPPAYSLTIAAGGLVQWLLLRRHPDRRNTTEILASGLIIGEGLVMVAVLFVREIVP
jgi:hypothetical protein